MTTAVTTRSSLGRQLRQLGIRPGAVVMVHASLRAVGAVVGGPDAVLGAIVDASAPRGTVMMYVGWDEPPEDLETWPPEAQRAWRDECPAFDPAVSRARRGHGYLAEALRTWPGARRSGHPEASIAAVGARADWIAGQHPLRDGYGEGSPLARLVEADGQVLMLGAPLSTVTLIHHAEHISRLPGKRRERVRLPVRRGGRREWVDIVQFDTCDGVVDGDYTLEQIAGAFVCRDLAQTGRVGGAGCTLFDAAPLSAFAVDWLERRFGCERPSAENRHG